MLARPHGAAVTPTTRDARPRGLDAVYFCVPPFAHGELELAVLAPGCRSSWRSRWPPTCATAERSAAAVAERRACRRRRATTGGTWTPSSRPARLLAGTRRSGWSTAPGGTRCRRRAWWPPARPLRRPGRRAGHPRARPGPAAGRRGRRGVRGRRRPSPAGRAATSTTRPRPCCASPPARSARSARPACCAAQARAPALEMSPTAWRCELTETALSSATPATAGGAADPDVDARTAVDRAFVDAVRGAGAPTPGRDVRRGAAHPPAGLRDRRGRRRPARRCASATRWLSIAPGAHARRAPGPGELEIAETAQPPLARGPVPGTDAVHRHCRPAPS